MSKSKSTIVTILVALMTAAIVLGLYQLHYRTFMVLLCCFAALGYVTGCAGFRSWLSKGQAIDPVEVKTLPVIRPAPVETTETVEDIIREMRKADV